jgi:serine/threonine-protein kinase
MTRAKSPDLPEAVSATAISQVPTAAAPHASRRHATSSPWTSEEGREFLQDRLSRYARLVFMVATGFFFASWFVALAWDRASLVHGLPLTATALFHLSAMAFLLTIWLTTRGKPLPVDVLRLIESVGIWCVSVAMMARAFTLSVSFRPDLLATLSLFALLLYRAAVVPSDPRRTLRIGILAVLPLPFLTYFAYSRAARPDLPSVWSFATYAIFFSALCVILSTATSRVIYGLQQTVREARRLGPYTLVTKIGEGGMGAVYRAQHALLKRPTAIKILPPEKAGEMDLARFEREVQMTSLLTSPHTVSVYDYGRTPDGLFYYAMEYLDGIDLNELVARDGPMHPGRVIRVLRHVSDALAEAHRSGLIHRDVKPANILLSERGGRSDFAKIVDFGLVKSLTSVTDGKTAEDIVLGTPYYMSPETVRTPDRIDARSDLYSLAATGYYLLTGTPVFQGSAADVFAALLRDAPEPPSKRLGRALPASLESVILAGLAKDPDQRPESVAAFEAALAACADVPPWTDADAAAWWKTRRPMIDAARTGGVATTGTLIIGRDARPAVQPLPGPSA